MPIVRTGETPEDALDRLTKRRGQLGTVFDQVTDAWDLAQRARDWYNQRRLWTVTITSDDRLYSPVLRWLVIADEEKPTKHVKAVYQTARRDSSFLDDLAYPGRGRGRDKQRVAVQIDDERDQNLTIAGHKVVVRLHRYTQRSSTSDSMSTKTPNEITFTTTSQAAQAAVVDFLQDMMDESTQQRPSLRIMTTWGDWERRDDLPGRPVESVALAAGQMESLLEDLQSFLTAEEDYVRRGMPYHRGYLLHGPPGTGKTSVVKALASHFGLDLWYAPLGDLTKDGNLLSAISNVDSRSILLLEDIDVFSSATTREAEKEQVTMAGLLNALDGVATPHGLIVCMTTNDLSAIDPAIIRPGRVDRIEAIDLPDNEQLARLYEFWFNVSLSNEDMLEIDFVGSTAEATEVLKRHMNDPVGALAALQRGQVGAEDSAVTHAHHTKEL